ncbi:response regulator [Streptomyces olivaceoviridis]
MTPTTVRQRPIRTQTRRDSATGVQRLVDAHDTDLVLMDIRMPRMDGLAATAALRRRADPPEVLILTTFTSDGYILDALRSGAAGYMLKHTPPEQIVAAVRNVMAGEPVLSSAAVKQLINAVTAPAADSGPDRRTRRAEAEAMLGLLAPRGREVAIAVAEGSWCTAPAWFDPWHRIGPGGEGREDCGAPGRPGVG